MMNPQPPFWSLPTPQVLQQTRSTVAGLSRQEAKERLSEHGANSLKQTHKSSAWVLLLSQFKSPIILILSYLCNIIQNWYQPFLSKLIHRTHVNLTIQGKLFYEDVKADYTIVQKS